MATTQIPDASRSCPGRTEQRTALRKRLAGVLAAGVLTGSTLFIGFAPAQAVSTGVEVKDGVLKVTASPGKSNSITVYPSTHAGKAHYTITDTGDAMVVGENCVRETGFNIRCVSAGVKSVLIETGDGNDTVRLDSMSLPSTVRAGTGNDVVFGGTNRDVLYGDEGNDTLHPQAGNDVAVGGAGVDRLTGGSGNDYLLGGEGHDNLQGNSGDDLMLGGGGNDGMYGQGGNDTMRGNAGNDTMYGRAGNDTMLGNDGNDTIHGEAGDDKLYGGTGNDYLHGQDGVAYNDHLDGEKGNDDCRADGGDTVRNCEIAKMMAS